MRPAVRQPIVLVPACNRLLGDHPFHVVGRKYVEAVRLAGCRPLVVPGARRDEIDALLDIADGVLLTGSRSNVHPAYFGEATHDDSLPLDADRDAWILPLIPKVLARSMPLFAICRGFQEMNVALGGTLHQAVHEMVDRHDHRGLEGADAAARYAPSHEVFVQPGGRLSSWLIEDRFTVNSVHGQGVNRLASGLRVEALAADGLVEAFTHAPSPGFNLGVQWHPEWRAADDPVSMRLLQAFGEACAVYRERPDEARVAAPQLDR